MAFKRREGLAGGGITKYADKNFHNCPFCGCNHPDWESDAYIAKYSMIGSKCINGYKFRCTKCGGIIEIQGNTDFCFQTERFTGIKLVCSGTGSKNLEKINQPISLSELKRLCLEETCDLEETSLIEASNFNNNLSKSQLSVNSCEENPICECDKHSKTSSVCGILSLIFGIISIAFIFMDFVLISELKVSIWWASLFFGISSIILGIISKRKVKIVIRKANTVLRWE